MVFLKDFIALLTLQDFDITLVGNGKLKGNSSEPTVKILHSFKVKLSMFLNFQI